MLVPCSTLYEEMCSFAAGLALQGVKTGDTVCQFSENSARWLVADQGAMLCGAANAVRGTNTSTQELAYIMKHSQCTGLIVQDAGVLSNLVSHIKSSGQRVRFVVVLWGDVSVAARQRAGVTVLTYADVRSPHPMPRSLLYVLLCIGTAFEHALCSKATAPGRLCALSCPAKLRATAPTTICLSGTRVQHAFHPEFTGQCPYSFHHVLGHHRSTSSLNGSASAMCSYYSPANSTSASSGGERATAG